MRNGPGNSQVGFGNSRFECIVAILLFKSSIYKNYLTLTLKYKISEEIELKAACFRLVSTAKTSIFGDCQRENR